MSRRIKKFLRIFMKEEEIENKIAQRFNEFCHIFPAEIDSADFRVKAVLDFFGDVNGKKILDIGCGKGRFSEIFFMKGANIFGIDPSEKLLKEAREKSFGKSFISGSATDLPFSDNTFDCVFCIEVLEHVPDFRKAVREMVRVLKRNGKLIIIDKNILSFHRKFILPYAFIKRCLEVSNKWFYPKNFQFREKWFFPWEVSKELKNYCHSTEREYLKGYTGKSFAFPAFLNLFIAWKGVK